MSLEKALIRPEAPKGAQPIPVLFNPTEYTLTGTNEFAETSAGLSSPIGQQARSRSLGMELFFDTYEKRTDVRRHTNKIYRLLEIEASTHAPPVCTFTWGQFSFRCVVQQVSGRFTLFLDDGTPVRASLSVTFKEYTDPETAARGNPTQSADHTKTYAVRRGDTVSAIAAAEYGDPTLWRPIARANRLDNPRRLSPGQMLVIPPLAAGGRA